MLHILNSQNTILNKFVAEIRDKSIQKRFDAFPP